MAAAKAAAAASATFEFRLAGLPGPGVELVDESDGEVLFRSDAEEVNADVAVSLKGYGKTLRVVLRIPCMQFEAPLAYTVAGGKYVVLEFREEGLRNAQSTDARY